MNHFNYKDGILCAESVPLTAIAESVGTPFYCYSTATLERHFTVFRDALRGLDATVCFAVKANANLAVIRTLAALGAGADVVSEGEMRRALAAGIPASKIVYSGVGKTERELEFALSSGIKQINVESEPELETIAALTARMGIKATIGIRVNPDVDAHTHAKITTGKKENKFGIDMKSAPALFARAAAIPSLAPISVAMQIGSQLTDLAPFAEAFARARALVLTLREQGIPIARVDVGGGLGIPYHFDGSNEVPPPPSAYGDILRDCFGDLGVELVLEPGRLLVGNAGILVSRVIYVKKGAERTFAICDAAMNDLVRPVMYDAYHEIVPVREAGQETALAPIDVVGPVCETGDTFAQQRMMPELKAGDLVAFASAGAYGSAMSSTYNARPLVPEVLVKGDAYSIVRARPTYEDMMAGETMPDWLR